ncbi:4-(cytidine 5'-diphospho)-2-C-methyl-D-erythritol kinase [Luteipulveratus flavus]|uniref:4-diphosphocytidyl-2-C-methyl-D-erythritol kinase n=1 Tax=Luteipulveratus flavus TaxID=3031728 RepID=A0ABT6CDM9_9MICO|nr:4-(cytidine 5'-diphospho)-2-C-methyl-D-erythritol kinase [Luteipulveratus sp. YIM 133296]MDF8266522.1 4-(cytidine 5'-diphospho)-2-C-methyl-D-erythritol kinase [Luteipulveratus sp. YIM 133296]
MSAPVLPPRGVSVRVPAKVNLELRVGPRRSDGFHGLSTVYHAVDLFDVVTVEPAQEWGLTCLGPYADRVPTDETNLALRAARAVAQLAEVDEAVHITIDKTIPVAGGMAGGSADAAGALVACDALWQSELSRAELDEAAAELGSDVPFLLTGGTAIGSGRGEQVVPVLTQGTFHWVFALHHGGLSTADVYAEIDRLRDGEDLPEPQPSEELMAALRAGDVDRLSLALMNDLEPAACSLDPQLQQTMAAGLSHGALATTVSGSGPTVAFLARDRAGALDLMVALSADGIADDLVHARGPVAGAQLLSDVTVR